MTRQNYVSAPKHNGNVMNPETALVASQVYTQPRVLNFGLKNLISFLD